MIYIVEDSHAIAEMMFRYLDRNQFSAEIIPTGAETIRRLTDGVTPRLIILDMKLNGVSGNDVLECIWSTGSEIPVIILTGNQDSIDQKYKDVVRAVFPKPPKFPLLLEAVKTHILTQRDRRQGLSFGVRLLAAAGDILTENKKALAVILPIIAAAAAALATYFGVGPKHP